MFANHIEVTLTCVALYLLYQAPSGPMRTLLIIAIGVEVGGDLLFRFFPRGGARPRAQ
jgi:hypothetical protein